MLDALVGFALRHRGPVLGLTFAAAAVGAWALVRLPLDAVPDITDKQVRVSVTHPSFSPLEMERLVTFPLESALAGAPGLTATRSISRDGLAIVTAIFAEDVDLWFARQQVAERLQQAAESLPPEAEPRLGPPATGLGEVCFWTLRLAGPAEAPASEPGRPGWQPGGGFLTEDGRLLDGAVARGAWLRGVQDWFVRPQVLAVRGVAGVDATGGHERIVQVVPDPERLAASGISFTELAEAIEAGNVSAGAGPVERHGERLLVRAVGLLEDEEDVAGLPVASPGGRVVRVRDLAEVRTGGEARMGNATAMGEEVVLATALMRIGGNSRTLAAAVRERLLEIGPALPYGVRLDVVLDRSRLVEATVRTVRNNLVEGATLVIVVLFLMLGNIRAALACALVIPLAMLLAAIGMLRAGISANLLSLGALDFGLIVDGAVIVVENCLRRLGEAGRAAGGRLPLAERLRTVRDATLEMARPAVFGQAIIVTVYLPVLALQDVEGRMFRPMAATVIFALLAAFLLSLTFVPALVAIFAGGARHDGESRALHAAGRLYAPALALALRRPLPILLGALLLFAGAMGLGGRLGQEFVPRLDEGDLLIEAHRLPGVGLEQATAMQLEVEQELRGFPEIRTVFSRTGTSDVGFDPMPLHVSDTFVMLRPRDEWPDPDEPKERLAARMIARLERLPGHAFAVTQPIEMLFEELLAGVRGDLAVKVVGDDFPQLEAAARRLARELEGIRGATAVMVEQTRGAPYLEIRLDHERLGRLGVAAREAQAVVAAAVGGMPAGALQQGDRRIPIVVRLDDERRADPARIRALPVPLPGGGFVPLSEVAQVARAEGPNQISRENGKRRVVVQASVAGRDLGSFAAEARARLGALELPPGTWLEWGGQYESLAQARARLALVVPACFALILLLLYGAFGGVRQALLVFSGVPLGLVGGVAALALRGIPLSISSAVGFIALSGVAVLNGIVLVSSIHALRASGAPLDQALREGARRRLRPVLTTALVASLGFVPMALATGPGAEVQRPLATVVIGGLVSSTLLTLLVLPAGYRLFCASR